MQPVTFILIWVIVWWMVWFAVLSFGLRQGERDAESGAPALVVDVHHLRAEAEQPEHRAPEVAQVRERVERDEVGAEHAEHHLAALRQAADHLVRRERHVQEEADAQPGQGAGGGAAARHARRE